MLDDAEIAYRVASWLEHIGKCWARLRDMSDSMDAMAESVDGIRAQSYEPSGRSGYKADTIGELVVEREEKRARMSYDAQSIMAETAAARRVIGKAWRDNPGIMDADFAYLMARYGEGEGKAEASRAAGLTAFATFNCARRCAPMLYAADPSRFARRGERPFTST